MTMAHFVHPFARIGLRTAILLFASGLIISIAAVDLLLGTMPVRAIFIVAALAVAITIAPVSGLEAVAKHRKPVLLIGLCAMLGAVVSLANGSDPPAILRQLLEIHVQAAVGLILIAILIRQAGLVLIASLFLFCWGLSASFSAAQFFGADFAWQARSMLGDVMQDPDITRHFYDQKRRALGLSFTPVHLATQSCLAFAAFFALRLYITSGDALRRLDLPICCAVILAMVICIMSGNRSPLLGFAIFLAIYSLAVAPRFFALALPFVVLASLGTTVLLGLMEETGLRVASFEDGSAIGRSTLARFGLQLLWDRPLGYGLLFESKLLAEKFVHQAIYLNNPEIIRHFSLHNYYLQMLNKYGVLVLALIPLLIPGKRSDWWGWMAFIPYIVHIAFHNDGPLSSDFLFWFVLPLFPAALATVTKEKTDKARPHISTQGGHFQS